MATPLRVLLVDDEPVRVQRAADVLGAAERRYARTLAEALAACASSAPDCVVFGLGLPDRGGLDALQALVEAHPDLPVVVLVGSEREAAALQRSGLAAAGNVHRSAPDPGLARAVSRAVDGPRRDGLRRAIEQASAVLAALPTAALVRDLDGDVVLANAAAQELLGLHLTEDGAWVVPGAGLREQDGGELPDAALPAARVLRTGLAEQERRLTLQLGDGGVRELEVDARPFVGADGQVLAVVETFKDVTDRVEAERRLRYQARLLEVVGQAVIATDAGGVVEFWNAAAERLYGWTAQEAVGRPVVELTLAEPSVQQAEEIMVALRAGLSWTGDFPVRRKDGSTFTAMVTNQPAVDDDGTVVGLIGVSSDVTERVASERAARQLAAIVESTGDAIIVTSLQGVVQSWNASAERLYGWSAEEMIGQPVSVIVPDDHRDEMVSLRGRVTSGDVVRDLRTVRVCRDGRRIEVALTASPVLDARGEVVAASSISRDITAQVELEQALHHAALHDDLTGLPNRALLTDRLEQALQAAERTGSPTSLLFVDLDGFKDVNDGQGHLLGDVVLSEVAGRLAATVRGGDTVGRFGGDEFVVVLPGTDAEEATGLAEELLAAVRQPLVVEDRRLHLSASIGLATAPCVPPVDLLRAADAAMFEGKARGRGQVVRFVGELSHQAEERLLLVGELRDALDDDRLHMVYQPVLDLGTGDVLGVEALVRWNHATRGPVPPGEFVPVAERSGMGRDLDRWVLRRSCVEMARLRADGTLTDAYLAVNVTAANVVDPQFVGTVRSALHDAGLPPTALVLEVTEHGVMSDLDLGVRQLSALRDLGVRVAIDDFGTGWSSLVYVRRLPASILKLDRTFVAGLTEDEDDLAIAVSVIDLARSTGMSVVAEGVETPEQLAVLQRLGCAAAQGYLWMPGVDVSELPRALGRLGAVPPPAPATVAVRPARATPPPPGQPAVAAEHGLERLTAMHAQGASLATIAAALNREGWRTPAGQRWHSKSVARVLAQPTLARLDAG